MRTTATITIETLGPDLDDLAVEISRNLFQYYRADSEILIARASAPDDSAETGQGPRRRAGNSITVAVSSHLPTYDLEQFPIQVCPPYVRLQTSDGGIVSYATDEAVAAIFLRPRPAERLELVVWGQNKASVVLAARLIPILTGTGQADFVILGKDCAGGGAAGVLAIGFFNQWWRVTGSSFLR